MAIEDRQIVQHLRTSGITAPPASSITDGEIALSMDNTNPKIFFKKNNGEIAEFVDKQYVVNGDIKLIEVTYNQLKTLVEDSGLTPGAAYRITDYVTTAQQENTQSSGHPFDIIVQALDYNSLSEDAKAIRHDGDTYFASSNLDAWKLRYCLDNDTNRFAWADATNGKGVIYYMKDEFGNECPYDFKNVQYNISNTNYYTFTLEDSTIQDYSLNNVNCHDNKISEYVLNGIMTLPFNVIIDAEINCCAFESNVRYCVINNASGLQNVNVLKGTCGTSSSLLYLTGLTTGATYVQTVGFDKDGNYQVKNTLSTATSGSTGLVKLYSEDGNNTDGAVTQESMNKMITIPATESAVTINPNIYYNFETRVSEQDLTITFAEEMTGKTNHYIYRLSIGATLATITYTNLPADLVWYSGTAPTFGVNKTYEISILNKLALYMQV